jgi:hypothetical protein
MAADLAGLGRLPRGLLGQASRFLQTIWTPLEKVSRLMWTGGFGWRSGGSAANAVVVADHAVKHKPSVRHNSGRMLGWSSRVRGASQHSNQLPGL